MIGVVTHKAIFVWPSSGPHPAFSLGPDTAKNVGFFGEPVMALSYLGHIKDTTFGPVVTILDLGPIKKNSTRPVVVCHPKNRTIIARPTSR